MRGFVVVVFFRVAMNSWEVCALPEREGGHRYKKHYYSGTACAGASRPPKQQDASAPFSDFKEKMYDGGPKCAAAATCHPLSHLLPSAKII